ncbi:hypothetical protein [Nocardia nepalensis]
MPQKSGPGSLPEEGRFALRITDRRMLPIPALGGPLLLAELVVAHRD